MDFEESRTFWNSVADDWLIQVGQTGDLNRRLNSDPVLWAMAGEVRGLDVLDAGCGTGYLSAQLHSRGARVTGTDFSERMVAVARAQYPHIDFRVDNCSELKSVPDAAIDLIVSNYVIMDTPDLPGTMRAFHRVLRPGGAAVLVFSHPCFPQGEAHWNGTEVSYRWRHSYFEQRKYVDPPWKHFRSEFIWYHRPLSDYWKAFREAGFAVSGFEEPRLAPDAVVTGVAPRDIEKCMTRPYSVAFRLEKA